MNAIGVKTRLLLTVTTVLIEIYFKVRMFLTFNRIELLLIKKDEENHTNTTFKFTF